MALVVMDTPHPRLSLLNLQSPATSDEDRQSFYQLQGMPPKQTDAHDNAGALATTSAIASSSQANLLALASGPSATNLTGGGGGGTAGGAPCRVGVVCMGREAPGIHNVVWGLYDALDSK